MPIVCPSYNSKEWKTLVNYFRNGGLNNEQAESEASRVFLAHDNQLPMVHTISELKKEIAFQPKGVSSLKRGLMLNKVKSINDMNNTSHRIDFKRTTPTSYEAKLVMNFMPRSLTSQVSETSITTVKEYGDTKVQTIEDPLIHIKRSGNEYITNGEVYPSYEDAERSLMYQKTTNRTAPADKELNNFLTDFLSSYGIKVEYLDNFGEKYGLDAVAVADLANKLISVSQGREALDTLPEEAAHFIIEMLGENHPIYKAMEAMIKETEEFRTVVDEYSQTYKGDEKMLMKESMGKILADYFIKRNKSDRNLTIPQKNVFGRAIDWFMKLFKKMDGNAIQNEKDRIFGDLANKVFSKNIKLQSKYLTGRQDIYAKSSELQSTINAAIAKLERKIKILEETGKRGGDKGKTEEILESIKSTVSRMNTELKRKRTAKAVLTYLEYIHNNELKFMLEEMKKFQNDPNSNQFTSTQLNEMIDLLQMYNDTVGQINASLQDKENAHILETSNGKGLSIKDLTKEIVSQLFDLDGFVKKRHEEKTIEIIEQIKHKDSDYDASTLIHSATGDMSWIKMTFGSLRNADDEALRMVYRIVYDIHNEVHRNTLARGRKLMTLQDELSKSGIKDMSVFHEEYEGKKTGFMISKLNYGEYYTEKERAYKSAKEAAGFKDGDVFNYKELSKENTAKYDKIMNKFSKKYNILHGGNYVPNPPKNPEFARLSKNKAFKNYYDTMMDMMTESREFLPSKYNSGLKNKYMLPQIRKDIMQTLKYQEGGLLKEIGARAKESVVVNEEDTEFGNSATGNSGVMRDINGNIAKLVPIHYVTKLNDTNQLSNDITSMVVKFYEMANNFNQVNEKIDDISVIQRSLGGRNFTKGKKSGGVGIESNDYKALDEFLDSFIYGKTKDSVEWKIPGTKVSVNMSKVSDKVINFVRANNLFLNIPTTISGWTKAGIDSFIDKLINNHTSIESGLWAEKEFDSHLHEILANISKKQKGGKLSLMFEYNAIFSDINETFDRLDIDSKIGRMHGSDFIYATYAVGDIRIKGKLALAVYNNHRLVDGEFITKRQFLRRFKDAKNKKWSDYKGTTLYDAYEAKNGVFTVKKEYKKIVTTKLENTIKNIVNERAAAIDGQLMSLDRPAIAKSVLGRFLLIHRGWLVSGLAERFKSKGINYQTEEVEEGFYRSFGRTVQEILTTANSVKHALSIFNSLDDYQKSNTIKMLIDLSMSALLVTVAAMVNGIADDDDDWWIQFLAWSVNRIRLEQLAFISPGEVINMMNSPTAATGLVETIGSTFKLVSNFEKIEYGAYEDMYQFQKAIIKNSLLKNIWELQAPKQKNKFLISQVF